MALKNDSSQAQLPPMTKGHASNNPIRRGLMFFAILVPLNLVIIGLIVPYILLLGSRYELSQAREQWQNNRPLAYQVSVWQKGFIEEPEACRKFFHEEGYVITVRGDQVTSNNAPPECKAIYEQLTIEKSFDRIDQALRDANPILAARPMLEFDSMHQWITHFYISQAETISSSRPSEWHEKFISYDNFKVLDAQSNSTSPNP